MLRLPKIFNAPADRPLPALGLLLLLALVVPLAVLSALRFLDLRDPTITLELEMEVPASAGSVELYLNQDWSNPWHLDVMAPPQKRFVFEDIPARIQHLRLNPADFTGLAVRIRSLRLLADVDFFRPRGTELYRFATDEWAQWGLLGIRWDEAAGALVSTTDDPTLLRAFDIDLRSRLAEARFPALLALVAAGISAIVAVACLLAALRLGRGVAALSRHRKAPGDTPRRPSMLGAMSRRRLVVWLVALALATAILVVAGFRVVGQVRAYEPSFDMLITAPASAGAAVYFLFQAKGHQAHGTGRG